MKADILIAIALFIQVTAQGATNATSNESSLRDYELRLRQLELAERDFALKTNSYELARQDFEFKKLGHWEKGNWLALGGLIGTGFALGFGYIQYRKADKWKRAEFLAREMKEFFDDPDVKNVLTMIDWAPRRINLFHLEKTDPKTFPIVTRQLQVSALRPHILLVLDGGSDSESLGDQTASVESGEQNGKFLPEEVRIRDSYDRFLDFLERFSSYLQSRLVSTVDLQPYVGYWIKDITDLTKNEDDAMWTCALLAYIEFYDFENVQKLFLSYGFDIDTQKVLFKDQYQVLSQPQNQLLAQKLMEACKARKDSLTAAR